MADLTVGRVGLGPTAPTLEVVDARWQGDLLTLSGNIVAAASDAERVLSWKAVRGQLLGLLEQDELVVPVTWAQDPIVDGYYSVEAAEVGSSPVVLSDGDGPFTVTLRRSAAYRAPLLDVRAMLALVPNAHGLVASTHIGGAYTGFSQQAIELGLTSAGFAGVESTATGAITLINPYFLSTPPTRRADYRYVCAPGSVYQGAATVEALWASSWWPVVGRQGAATANRRDIRIGNGQVRVTPSASSLLFEWWVAGSWSTTRQLTLSTAGTTNLVTQGLASVTVLRNSPETCSVRCAYTGASNQLTFNVDLIVQRGSRMVHVAVSDGSPPLAGSGLTYHLRQWSLARSPGAAAAALPLGGISAGSIVENAGTQRLVLCCPDTNTQDLANCALTQTATSQIGRFGVGLSLDHGSGVLSQNSVGQGNDYYAALAQRMIAVGR